MKHFLLSILALLAFQQLNAQNGRIGTWRGHMPYGTAVSIATDGVMIYVASGESFFTYNSMGGETIAYSKAEGMSDAMMSYVAYDDATGMAILAYTNSNIDLFKQGSFYNIPDIKLKVINGDKTIYSIYTENGLAYLATGFGVVVLDIEKREIKETYSFITNNQTIAVKSFVAAGDYFYAATQAGLYRAGKNQNNLQAFSSWQQIDPRETFISLAKINQQVFAATPDTLFKVQNSNSVAVVFGTDTTSEFTSINSSTSNLLLDIVYPQKYYGEVKEMDEAGNFSNRMYKPGQPKQTVRATNGSLWTADGFDGAYGRADTVNPGFVNPTGPATYTSYNIIANGGEVWVAHGMISEKYSYNYNRNGLSRFYNNQWTSINQKNTPVLQDKGASDFISVLKDPTTGTLYSTSFRSGMMMQEPGGQVTLLREGVFDESQGDPGAYRVGQMAMDKNGNIWMPQSLASHDLVMKNRNNQWFKFAGPATQQYAFCIAIDDYDQKWYSIPGKGVIVMNDGGTPELPGDDHYRTLTTGDNMPGAEVYSLANDREGTMWIGTDNGIGIVSCPGDIISGGCTVEKPIVQFDQFAGYLFQNEKVKAIAVDGANRKWIGTSNGVWLISPDGDKIIERFTAENSPLPSNSIQDIAIDAVTGDVYFGTDLGLVSYRGTATDGAEENTDIVVFPNPVRSGYNGTIAIKGLVTDADIRITDIAGQLVYRTKALGGQAVWNGLDYTGHRPQTGVYLIFITNADGTQTHTGKMIFTE